VAEVENQIAAAGNGPRLGIDTTTGCRRYFELQLIEAIYLSNRMNKTLTSITRQVIIDRGVHNSRAIRRLAQSPAVTSAGELERGYRREDLPCPLLGDEACLLPQCRPLSCRLFGRRAGDLPTADILVSLSRAVFLALAGVLPDQSLFRPSLADVVSGRFIQTYFHYLRSLSSEQ
jgi:hypothetical protein